MRWDRPDRPLVCAVNFAGVPHEGYRLGLPDGGRWNEVVNTDDVRYGGSGVANSGGVEASSERPHWGQPASADLRIPPLGAVWFVPEVWPPAEGGAGGAAAVESGDDVTEASARDTDASVLDEMVTAAEPPEFLRGEAPEAPRA